MKIVVKAAGSLEPPGTLTSPFLTTVYGGVAFTPSGHTANYIVNCVRCQIIVATEMKKEVVHCCNSIFFSQLIRGKYSKRKVTAIMNLLYVL